MIDLYREEIVLESVDDSVSALEKHRPGIALPFAGLVIADPTVRESRLEIDQGTTLRGGEGRRKQLRYMQDRLRSLKRHSSTRTITPDSPSVTGSYHVESILEAHRNLSPTMLALVRRRAMDGEGEIAGFAFRTGSKAARVRA